MTRSSRNGDAPGGEVDCRIGFGPFVLDRRRSVLTRRGERVPLGGRGIRLLDALASRPGEAIPKAELLDIGWPGASVEESNLSVQIALLRKAIGRAPDGTDWIITVPRIGYAFTAGRRGDAYAAAAPTPPAVVVLPFVAVGSDGELGVFTDGLTEELALALSKAGFATIARSSSFAYRDRTVDVRQVAAELGAGHAVEGSVRREGNHLRITARLVDGSTDSQLWAERYDRTFAELFSVQDDIARRVVAALAALLAPGEVTLWPTVPSRGTGSIDAYHLFLRGRAMQRGPVRTRAVHARAGELFAQAIAVDPGYAAPYAALAMGAAYASYHGWADDPAASLAEAYHLADEAISRDAGDAYVHGVAALVAMYGRDLERWAFEVDEALALDRNFAPALALRATLRLCSGDPDGAVADLVRAMRLDPHFTHHYLHDLGVAHLVAGSYDAAVAAFRERLLLVPDADETRAYLAAALGNLGQVDEAREVWAEVMSLNPAFKFRDRIASLPFRRPEDLAKVARGLDRAGLPTPAEPDPVRGAGLD